MSKKKVKNVKVICNTCKKPFYAIEGSKAEVNKRCFRIGCKDVGKTFEEMMEYFQSNLK